MADVNRLVFSIIRFLEDQKTAANLSDEGVEGLEGQLLLRTIKNNCKSPFKLIIKKRSILGRYQFHIKLTAQKKNILCGH